MELDPRFTFETFVVGPANRLAVAAARRVAEMPGAAYNPLFIYSASGLGKTHLISAIAHHAGRLQPDLLISYDTFEHFMEEALSAVESGDREAFRNKLRNIGLLVLDDVQFLAGKRGAQDELLRALDALSSQSGQLVLASDRPPADINDLDDRLLSRFSGGLIADIGMPDYEMRVAIVNRKAGERGQSLAAGVAEALSRLSFANVRELQGGLNRLLAVQELDGRLVTSEEVTLMFGPQRRNDEFGSFLDDISGTVDRVVASVELDRRIADAIKRFAADGFVTRRLEAALREKLSPPEIELLLQRWEADLQKLQDIERELAELEPHAPELRNTEIFRNPDRLPEAEAMLHDAHERNRPLPGPPPGRSFKTLMFPTDTFAVRVARAIAEKPGHEYNPLLLHGADGSGKTTLLAALANEFLELNPHLPVAFVHGKTFAAEVIQALEKNRLESWRARYRQARLFVLDDLEALADTERAQEELFHLFDELRRADAQMAFGSAKPPSELNGMEERLRSRLESGLVLELEVLQLTRQREDTGDAMRNRTPAAWVATMAQHQDEREPIFDDFFLSREKIIWNWPYLEDCLFEELE